MLVGILSTNACLPILDLSTIQPQMSSRAVGVKRSQSAPWMRKRHLWDVIRDFIWMLRINSARIVLTETAMFARSIKMESWLVYSAILRGISCWIRNAQRVLMAALRAIISRASALSAIEDLDLIQWLIFVSRQLRKIACFKIKMEFVRVASQIALWRTSHVCFANQKFPIVLIARRNRIRFNVESATMDIIWTPKICAFPKRATVRATYLIFASTVNQATTFTRESV